jgi:hypothetical protein
MIRRLAMVCGASLLLAACAASPDYGYGHGYASSDYGYGGYGPYAYDYGPSVNLELGFGGGDRDRGDRGRRFASRDGNRDEARSGSGGEHRNVEVGRGAAPRQAQATGRGGEHGDHGDHGGDHDRR